MESKKKSVLQNVSLSSLNTLITILFSFITFPYVSRVLSVEGIGAVNFSNSIIGYLSLGAALGMGSFAVRNGSRIKNSKAELTEFASQIFSINVIAMLICLLIMLILLLVPTKLINYRIIILIQSMTLITSPMTLTWFYSIFEDFKYITIRNFAIKIVSLLLLIFFVRTEKDIINYVLICSLGDVVANIVNFIHSRKYLKIKITFKTRWCIYKKSIMVFFINSLATTIYLNSDITMLGFLCNEISVGYYSVSTKIYNILKQVINAGIIAALPRLAYYAVNSQKEFKILIERIINIVIIISLPITVGIFILNKDIILVISGSKYLESTKSLLILSIAILLTMLANVFTCGVLISYKKENVVMIITMISAIVNIGLNFILIPIYAENAAAITTVIAEITVLSISIICSKEYIKGIQCRKTIRNTIVACIMMAICSFVVLRLASLLQVGLIFKTVIIIMECVFVYLFSLILLCDENVYIFINKLKLCRMQNDKTEDIK